ncbi:MAG TPA: DUF4365 domain-containing protein, partial [Chthonomonadaceae bacterium]|nr:DUF4365 domain-containing protein [Chthonomonadaceae bacterium]
QRLGLKMIKRAEGAADITVYCEPAIPEVLKATFLRYIHDHLKAKDPDLELQRHYSCPRCGKPIKDQDAVNFRLAQKKKDIPCAYCGAKVLLLDLIQTKFASVEVQQTTQEMAARALASIDNESRELILVGHAFAIAGEAGQIFRPIPNSDWGIDGEIEFKNDKGEASGKRVYLQLKSGDSYLHERKTDGQEIFRIKDPRHAEYWQAHAYPVMLVIRTSDGQIRWMNVTDYLKQRGSKVKQILFDGEPFTALSVVRLRDRVWPPPPTPSPINGRGGTL